ncbi:MAG TPA: hypothetical protein VF057_00705 [Thermoanaerobaculia bacterium]
MSSDSQDPRASFAWFTQEYSQALQAFETIEKQASTIIALGGAEELRVLIQQFVEMATSARNAAVAQGEEHFAEWFGELIEKAEAIRGALVQ